MMDIWPDGPGPSEEERLAWMAGRQTGDDSAGRRASLIPSRKHKKKNKSLMFI